MLRSEADTGRRASAAAAQARRGTQSGYIGVLLWLYSQVLRRSDTVVDP